MRRNLINLALLAFFQLSMLYPNLPVGAVLPASSLPGEADKGGEQNAQLPGQDHSVYLPLVLMSGVSTWTPMMTEDFEGDFPTSLWKVYDGYTTGDPEHYWGKSSCRASSGSFSAWAVGSGVDGGVLGCGASYPNRAHSWMVYGPFSLAGARAAQLSFKFWLNSEAGNPRLDENDYLCALASPDGKNYGVNFFVDIGKRTGVCSSGQAAWETMTLDLARVPNLGSLLDKPEVWVAIYFGSDIKVTHPEGAYVDQVVLRKCSTTTCQ